MIPALPRSIAFQLIVIRTAMLLGLVLFGLSTFYVKRKGDLNVLPEDRAQLFTYIFIGLAGAALAGMVAIRSRLGTLVDVRRIYALYLIGYALAEAAALFGAVTWFVGGAREWFIAGLVLMAVAFQVLPVRRDTQV